MLLKGEAGPPDPKRALPLLEAASAANHPMAQYELAQMYETGQDGLVPKDLTVARRLYTAAAGHGMKEAQARLDQLGPDTAPAPALRLMQPAPQVQAQTAPAAQAPAQQTPGQTPASGQTPGAVPLRPAQP
jgi:TPR repeat protein